MGVFPIVNENDTISMIVRNSIWRNDTLSAITAGMVNVDYLFLMTDVDCLYTDNPRTNPDAKPVKVYDFVAWKFIRNLRNGNKAYSSRSCNSCWSHNDHNSLINTKKYLSIIANLSNVDDQNSVSGGYYGLHTAGTILIDEGAIKAITNAGQKSSLFAAAFDDMKDFRRAKPFRDPRDEGESDYPVAISSGKVLLDDTVGNISPAAWTTWSGAATFDFQNSNY
ncbi:10397_t:CDS:2 [Funneliformis caledonium]|uniref:10397_t:CDS:1 n=1 Tax=Funneliformis caledonium TaxID=1117310 RepID=A0A9N9AQG8_9GLOM|nr:10397_t:CDS:2 [Funneliformis caledonium]